MLKIWKLGFLGSQKTDFASRYSCPDSFSRTLASSTRSAGNDNLLVPIRRCILDNRLSSTEWDALISFLSLFSLRGECRECFVSVLFTSKLHGRLFPSFLWVGTPDKAEFLFLRRFLVSYLTHYRTNLMVGVREIQVLFWVWINLNPDSDLQIQKERGIWKGFAIQHISCH